MLHNSTEIVTVQNVTYLTVPFKFISACTVQIVSNTYIFRVQNTT